MKTINWKKNSRTYLDDVRRECSKAMSQIDNISNYKWHFFRKLLNDYDFESRQFAVNRAFYKLWEMLSGDEGYILPTSQSPTTLHLAEAPGSFVQVVKKKLPVSRSVAVSKPPSTYAEVVKKSRTVPMFSPPVLAMEGVSFKYVDILHLPSVERFLQETISQKEAPFSEGFDFITADGGFDEEEQYDLKEVLHYNLILSEIVLILLTQKKEGSCVLKIFETFTETTFSILWLLCQHYETFHFVKPLTSRPTNAEKYLICTGFKGLMYKKGDLTNLTKMNVDSSMKLDISMPPQFEDELVKVSEEFTRNQIDTINRVVQFVKGLRDNTYVDKRLYSEKKQNQFDLWRQKFHYEEYT
jgi:23S rRNA U2552 (ribose-2'-O)-methylase RlmE/FtsJ